VGDIKVTDRRMFTPDGRVREDYAEPESAAEASPPAAPAASAAQAPAVPPPDGVPETFSPHAPPASGAPHLELPGAPPGLGPSFLDLVGVLTEPVPFYLGDAALPDGQTMENLEAARLHIDLLDVLRQRTAGNLTAQEQGVLDDLLYRLRVRYVQKRG
jgi:hypothetical protein